jgi:hypothetical protein
MGASYYISIVNNVFAIMGLAGILQAQRELIIGFFAYNATQMVGTPSRFLPSSAHKY